MCKVVFRGVGRRKLQQCGVFLLELPAAHSAGWLVENVANRVLSLFETSLKEENGPWLCLET